MRSVTLKSAMTPSFMGLIATMLPGVRPSISLASLPTASTSPVFLLSATMDGSLTTMPLPLANTKVFAVPKSMARSDENRLNRERRFIKDVRYELEGRRLHAVKASHLNASIFCAFRTSNRKAGTSACRTLDPPFTACGRSRAGGLRPPQEPRISGICVRGERGRAHGVGGGSKQVRAGETDWPGWRAGCRAGESAAAGGVCADARERRGV